MLCPKCKQEIPKSALVCPNCGINISEYFTELLNQQSVKQTRIKYKQPLINRYIFYTFWAIVAAGLIIVTLSSRITPHFRSYISRTKGEQHSLAIALEAYYIDYNTYPTPDYDVLGNPIVPKILAIPINNDTSKQYLRTIPTDPFTKKSNQPYRYYTGWTTATVGKKIVSDGFWIVAGNGPNKKPDLAVTSYTSSDSTWYQRYGIFHEYDPTNGSKSSGDIFRTGP
ncbi:MAG: hypothetical protein ACE14V_06440 [bacterium]